MSTTAIQPVRSRNGCWTCKRRRRKCDEIKPTCNICRDAGHVCEGYESRLRWDIGVASRGHLMYAAEPKPESAPARARGRRRDLLKRQRQEQSLDNKRESAQPSVFNEQGNLSSDSSAITPRTERDTGKQRLFDRFLQSGIHLLHATTADDSPLLPILPRLCQRSETLYEICVACQALLEFGTSPAFYEYYSEALSKFRAHLLDHTLRQTDEALLNAALLLCTIGILQGTPWTIHISGMDKLLGERSSISPVVEVSLHFAQAIEVMGIMDLNAFVVGRQHRSLNVWRRYRQGQLVHCADMRDGVQTMSGLPHSLIDLIAMDKDLTEEMLWSWTGCDGTLLQSQMWDAYRFSLMLDVRHRRSDSATVSEFGHSMKLPSDDILLTKALSCIDAVYNGIEKAAAAGSLLMNAMLLPLYHVAIMVLQQEDSQGRHNLVEQWFHSLLEKLPYANTRQAWDVVQEYRLQHRQGIRCSPDDIAQSIGIEVGLF